MRGGAEIGLVSCPMIGKEIEVVYALFYFLLLNILLHLVLRYGTCFVSIWKIICAFLMFFFIVV